MHAINDKDLVLNHNITVGDQGQRDGIARLVSNFIYEGEVRNGSLEGYGRMIREGMAKIEEEENDVKCPPEAECKQAFDGTVFAVYKGKDIRETKGYNKVSGLTIK